MGDRVDAQGRLAPESMERVRSVVDGYRERAVELGASPVLAIATSAARDAANGREFVDEPRAAALSEPRFSPARRRRG